MAATKTSSIDVPIIIEAFVVQPFLYIPAYSIPASVFMALLVLLQKLPVIPGGCTHSVFLCMDKNQQADLQHILFEK